MSQQPGAPRILVVDDEQVNVTLLERILDKAGYSEVRSTTDPQEGLRLWEEFRPDLLLLDLMMPSLDGFGFMEAVSRSQWAKEATYVPILVLTADVSPAARDRALMAGAKDFLTKPFDHTEVRLRIANLLEARSLHKDLAHANNTLEARVQDRTARLWDSLQQLEVAHEATRKANLETIHRLAIASEFRDDDTGRHIQRMSRYCGILVEIVEGSPERREMLEVASQMHDVGKIGIPDAVLLTPRRLTAEERKIIETHAEIGHRILEGAGSPILDLAAAIALTHHERVDGNGYPRGLRGDGIPIEGRIAAIADVFDALTTDRVYRPAFPLPEALQMMSDGRGSQFDADLLDQFLETLPKVLEVKESIEQQGSFV